VDNVLEQTYRHEHIVIDRASIDDSKALLESTGNTIAYWVSEPNKGIYHPMLTGIKIAKGTYLLFLNGGDTLL